MAPETNTTFLAELPLFAGLDAAARARLESMVEARELAAGSYLFRQGDPSTFVFAVQAGRLEAVAEGDGGPTLLRVLSPGDVGGLTSMVVAKGRSATLRALDPARVLTIPKPRFLELLHSTPALAEAMIAALSDKVRTKTVQVASLLGAEARATPPVAVFDAKPYDRDFFELHVGDGLGFRYFEARLGPDTVELAKGHRVVCPFVNDHLDRSVIEGLAAHGVGLIALRCAGYNNVDLAAAEAHGISVVRVPAYSPHAVAEHAVALLLALNRKTHRAYNRVREGNFSLAGLVGFDLHGRTAGVIGLGKIGRCLAEILVGFGMRVLAHDPYPDETYARDAGLELTTLDELLKASDVVSLHSPLLPSTHHLINAARIATMKQGVVLINTSRGGLVDAAALIDGLKSGQIGAAGLDVYEEESDYFFQDRSDRVIADDLLARLMTFNNVIITSHQAFLTEEALGNIAATTAGSIREFLAGRRRDELTHRVPPPTTN